MPTITVTRNRERMNAHLAYKILINDRQVEELNVGEEVSLSVLPGDKLKIWINWSGSQEYTIPTSPQEQRIVCGGNLTYNTIGNAGGVLFLALIVGTNLLVGSEVGKKIGLGLALAVMLLLLYMLTVGKSNWIRIRSLGV